MRIFSTRRFDSHQKLPMQGFTMAELLVVSALALLVGGMLLAAFFFGNRMWQITQTKIHTTDKTRQVIRLLTSDVHAAKTLRVGNGTLNSFSEAAVDSPQTGNALQVYPTFDTNYFVRYYRDAADKKLKCITNGAGTPVVIAKSVTNPVVFQMEDFAGNVLTGKQNNCVIGLTLDFSEIEEPGVPVGPGAYYRSFRIATKIGKRAL
jgi:Tfp pilus assembly protein PilW